METTSETRRRTPFKSNLLAQSGDSRNNIRRCRQMRKIVVWIRFGGQPFKLNIWLNSAPFFILPFFALPSFASKMHIVFPCFFFFSFVNNFFIVQNAARLWCELNKRAYCWHVCMHYRAHMIYNLYSTVPILILSFFHARRANMYAYKLHKLLALLQQVFRSILCGSRI